MQRVSNTTTAPNQSNPNVGANDTPSMSADGRYVAYAAEADAAAPNASWVIIRRDNQTGATVRVDVASDGTPANSSSREPSISADGRYVAFTSDADNLVSGDDNSVSDVFVRDVQAGTTTRVSVATDGTQGDADSYSPSISADGRYVALTSDSDLLDPNDANASPDVFVRDRQANTTTLESVWTDGTQTDFGAWDGVISADGKHVAFTTDTDLSPNDTNTTDDIYMRDLTTNTTRWVSNVAGNPGGDFAAISGTGQYVAYVDGTSGYVLRRDMSAGTALASAQGATTNGFAGDGYPSISGDGRWIAFASTGNASGNDTNGSLKDVFVRDMVDKVTTIGSTDGNYQQRNVDSYLPALSPDGRYVAWVSAGAFDSSDTNGLPDVYVRGAQIPVVTSVSPSSVARGTTTTITVTGRGFIAPVSGLIGINGTGVTVNSGQWISDTTATLNITVAPNASTGSQILQIVNAGTGLGLLGATGACVNCFTVT